VFARNVILCEWHLRGPNGETSPVFGAAVLGNCCAATSVVGYEYADGVMTGN